MDQLEKILDLIDHPERYTEEEVQALLRDEEYRKLYQTIADVDAAFVAKSADPDVDEEWTQWQQHNNAVNRPWQRSKWAAMFIGILVVSGLAFAAVRFAQKPTSPEPKTAQTEQFKAQQNDSRVKDSIPATPERPAVHKIFENATLEKIIDEIADYYQKTPVYHNSDVKKLRLYYEWDSRKGLQGVTNDLNQFENISVSVEGTQLIIE